MMHDTFPSDALVNLYGAEDAARCEAELRTLVSAMSGGQPNAKNRVSVWLLAYPAHLEDADLSGMQALNSLLDHTDDQFQHLHLLPPFRSGGDFGFAPADHFELESKAGTWNDLKALSHRRTLSIDLILNHVAPSHPWAEAVLAGKVDLDDEPFIRVDPHADYSALARSRHHPPVSAYGSVDGVRHYWTRYGHTQIDLDYRKPQVLIRMAKVLVEYAHRGVGGLRLDALAFLWKDASRSSANEPEVFHLLEVFRWIADRSGLTTLIAEGDVCAGVSPYVTPDARRASIAYRYESAPVVLSTLLRSSSAPLMKWIQDHGHQLHRTPALNFLSTHDGVYLRPYDPPVPPQDIDVLARATLDNGGAVIERVVNDAVLRYELDISIIDLLDGEGDGAERLAAGITLICWLPGTPMVYLGHLLGVRNDDELVRVTGDERARNRGSISLTEGLQRVRDGIGARVIEAVREFREVAAAYDAFDPASPIGVGPDLGDHVVSVTRTGANSSALCLLSLGKSRTVQIPAKYRPDGRDFVDLGPWESIVLHEIGSKRESAT
ncbi:alpha-amylase family glycosyl hydrolase [Leifsonia sp. NPDC056665]|uniref:alpha-amylase family glycosyl hydrolase n=1 Tax=Leifsonia sp. NPDC056665 TaxID=3345901 RepID=UPI0036A2A0F3